jgi:hypothetical protein
MSRLLLSLFMNAMEVCDMHMTVHGILCNLSILTKMVVISICDTTVLRYSNDYKTPKINAQRP